MANAEQIDVLAQAVQAGRVEAFDGIVSETVATIRSVVHFLIADNELADDVVQETYILLYREIGKYVPGTNFLAWAKAIARTQALSARFRRQRKQTAAERYRETILDQVTQVFEVEDQEDPVEGQLQRLRRCLGGLQQKARSMVELRYFHRKSMEAVADERGMKTGAVAVSLHRIREALSTCMESTGGRL